MKTRNIRKRFILQFMDDNTNTDKVPNTEYDANMSYTNNIIEYNKMQKERTLIGRDCFFGHINLWA